MQNKSLNIEDKVKLTLEELDHLKPIEASPFFFSRLSHRLVTAEEKKLNLYHRIFSFEMLRPVLLILLIAINLFSIIKLLGSNSAVKVDPYRIMDNIAEGYANTTSIESVYYINVE